MWNAFPCTGCWGRCPASQAKRSAARQLFIWRWRNPHPPLPISGTAAMRNPIIRTVRVVVSAKENQIEKVFYADTKNLWVLIQMLGHAAMRYRQRPYLICGGSAPSGTRYPDPIGFALPKPPRHTVSKTRKPTIACLSYVQENELNMRDKR